MRISGTADRNAPHLLVNFVTPRQTDRLEDARANEKHISLPGYRNAERWSIREKMRFRIIEY
jgi:hypothetical protein